MTVRVAYFDSSFLFRLYWNDPGYAEVRHAAATVNHLVCAAHGRVELIAAAQRKWREGTATGEQMRAIAEQLRTDCNNGGIRWFPLTDDVLTYVEETYLKAPAGVFLRSADALHLACAYLNGLEEIYSNDRHLLAAAPLFGLRAVNLIA
jgi:predicted nucleic acid-binding protein